MNLSDVKINDFAGLRFECTCGKTHIVDIKKIIVKKKAINDINRVLSQIGCNKILLVADINTYKAAGKKIEELMKKDYEVKTFVYQNKKLSADYNEVGRLLVEVDSDIDAIVTVGSGTLNDITKMVSARTKIPSVIVCTAPSMDGYASMVSSLIVDGIKTTYPVVYPYAIIADIDILKKAPVNMLKAGFGDVMGKYTALADWKISQLLWGEYYCDNVVQLVRKVIEKCIKTVSGIRDRNDETVEAVIEALILSGLAIGMIGFSRPASGSEHQIAHIFEMVYIREGHKCNWLHGNKVGVTTSAVLQAYDILKSLDIEKLSEDNVYINLDSDIWQSRIIGVLGECDGKRVINKKIKFKNFEKPQREEVFRNIYNKWSMLKENIPKLVPSCEDYIEIMKKNDIPYFALDIDVNSDLFLTSLIIAKEIRNRYGVMQLLEDLGILDEAASIICDNQFRSGRDLTNV